MKLLSLLVLFATSALPSLVMAKDLKIETEKGKFNITRISASNVKGVSLRLSQVIKRDDCNKRSIGFNLVYLDGNDDVAWHQTSYASASTMMTLMGCPLEQEITETIYSEPVVLNSLMNANANGEVLLTIIVPAEYRIEATEVN